jgi:hypothetical protein
LPALGPGARLGPYEIVAAIGAGGMGEVYRARDTRLGRDVAIKILPEALALDPDRVARFRREAQLVAALNHPNIAAIHGVEESGGMPALVLELVEGPTLADRIAQGPIPVDDALAIASQIADALEAAHERGIIHRDLKPANIKLRDDGTVKVLDFGLAKALEGEHASPDISMSPTMSIAATRMGVILGTAAYMAPEQARGKAVDRRTDIWAFGCVLYEMVTGKRAFEGEDISDTLAAILRGEPDWSRAPTQLRSLLHACLEKDRKKRLQAIADYPFLISNGAAADAKTSLMRHAWLPWSVAALTILVATGVVVGGRRGTTSSEALRRLSIPLPESAGVGFAALSPNGRAVAIEYFTSGGGQLAVRSLDSNQYQTLPGAMGARAPFWSPDGRFIGFFADGKLKTVRMTGGTSRILCDAGGTSGGTWNAGGIILFGTDSGTLQTVSAGGGACSTIATPSGSARYRHPVFLPDGRHYFYEVDGDDQTVGLYVAALDDTKGRRLLPDRSSAVFVPIDAAGTRGHLLIERAGRLVAQPFDVKTFQVGDDEILIAEDASFTANGFQLSATVADDGSLLYISNPPAQYQPTWFDRSGKELAKIGAPTDGRPGAAVSPDGKAALFAHNEALWLYDMLRNVETRLANNAGSAVWSPDGTAIAYQSRGQIAIQDVRGGQPVFPIRNDNPKAPSDWSRDGQFLIYTEVDPKTQADIWLLPNPRGRETDTRPMPFLRTEFLESQGTVVSRRTLDGVHVYRIRTAGGVRAAISDRRGQLANFHQWRPRTIVAR